MTNFVTFQLQAPPDTISIHVDYYDAEERESFLSSPMASIFGDLPREITIPTQDLCTKYLYYKKRLGVGDFSSQAELARKWSQALVEFDGQVEFGNSSIHLTEAEDMSTGTIERLGEAIGLSVASKFHGLHQADWTRIGTTTARKTLDFSSPWIASDGRQFVQVETKGSAVQDNKRKPSTVSNHKASIKAKKREATQPEKETSVLYGTIGVLDTRPGSVARCWLVDPPIGVPDDPDRFKVVARLSFIADLISFLSPRSSLAASLRTRLLTLNALQNISALDGQPLLNGSGEPYSTATVESTDHFNPWFSSKSTVRNGRVGGRVYLVNRETLLFIGIQEDLVVFAAQQDFAQLRTYSFSSGTVEQVVDCVVSRVRFKSDFSPVLGDHDIRSSGGYVYFSLTGHIHFTQSGLVIGVLPIPSSSERKVI